MFRDLFMTGQQQTAKSWDLLLSSAPGTTLKTISITYFLHTNATRVQFKNTPNTYFFMCLSV